MNSDSTTLDYPLISISYCVKCKWMLRAAWYQQEILQTFSSNEDPYFSTPTVSKTTINSVNLKPSLIAGTFRVCLKISEKADWIILWDRTTNGGFPDSKMLKQKIKEIINPDLQLNHIDKPNKNDGKLITSDNRDSISTPIPEAIPITSTSGSINSETPIEHFGSPKLAAARKTFCEECLENTKAWEG